MRKSGRIILKKLLLKTCKVFTVYNLQLTDYLNTEKGVKRGVLLKYMQINMQMNTPNNYKVLKYSAILRDSS